MPRGRCGKINSKSKLLISSGVTGEVKAYLHDNSYGFITEDAVGYSAVFFHISTVVMPSGQHRAGDPVRVGDKVKFDLYLGPKGYRAESVQIMKVEDSNTDFDDDLLYGNEWFRGSENERAKTGGYRFSYDHDDQNATRRGRGQSPSQSGEGVADASDSYESKMRAGETGKRRCRGRRGGRHRHGHAHDIEKPKKIDAGGGGEGKECKPGTTSFSSNQTCYAEPREDAEQKGAASTPTELSWSTKQRERGNIFYKSATDDFSAIVRISRLDNAITCYKHAVSCSTTRDDEASALKNIGMASWKLAAVALESADSDEEDKVVLKHYKEASKYFCMAYILKSFKSVSWGSKLEQSWENCLEESTDWLATMDTTERVAGFSELLGYVPDCRLKANGYIQYSTLLFHEGLTSWQDGAYKECYRYMRECYYPIQEAERLCEDDTFIKTEVGVLREDVYIHTCIAESLMARTTGDDLLDDHLKNEETINTDTVWTAIDFYKQAAVLCRDKDLEQEAIAYSRLGRVYGKILNLSSKGKDYYKKAIQLALSMTPRTFHGVGWFKESTEFVEDFQKRLNKDEEEDKDKEAALEEMKEDVEKLTEMAEKDDEEFVKELYEAWPPKDPGAKVNDKLTTQKKLLKAVSHYHPDKVDKEVHGKNWFYFSGEITKQLNIKYARYKSVD